jgi:galactosyl transferase GMA12/MNN10 family
VMLSRDYNNLNTGNVFFRNVPEAFEILDRVDAQRHLTFHEWWEQAAYIELYETDAFAREHLRVVDDQRLFNSYPTFLADRYPDHCYRQGDLLIHFAGLWKEQAAVGMSESLGILRRSLGPTSCPQRSL